MRAAMSDQARPQNPAAPMDDQLPVPIDPGDAADLVWAEFCGQFRSYDRNARKNRLAYQCSKVSAIVIAAAVTVCAAIGVLAWVTATLAALVVVLEGLQQMFQWQRNWIEYRRTAETMRQHGLAFAARTGAYAGDERRERLAGLLREMALTENQAWAEGIAGKHPAG
jgi:hypothetical protein